MYIKYSIQHKSGQFYSTCRMHQRHPKSLDKTVLLCIIHVYLYGKNKNTDGKRRFSVPSTREPPAGCRGTSYRECPLPAPAPSHTSQPSRAVMFQRPCPAVPVPTTAGPTTAATTFVVAPAAAAAAAAPAVHGGFASSGRRTALPNRPLLSAGVDSRC